MCFSVDYDCSVSCVNAYLNTTALKSGLVTGDGYGLGCSITCAEGVQGASWGATHNAPLEPASVIDVIYNAFTAPGSLIIIGIIIIAIIVAMALYYHKDG